MYLVQLGLTPETLCALVDLWTQLVHHPRTHILDRYTPTSSCAGLDRERITVLVLSNGEGTTSDVDNDVLPAELQLFAWSDHGGSDLDVANARTLAEAWPDVVTLQEHGVQGRGSATVRVGVSFDIDDAIQAAVRLREGLLDPLRRLDNDCPLLDEQVHSRYVDELVDDAWDRWLADEVRDAINDALEDDRGEIVAWPEWDTVPLAAAWASDPRERDVIVREVYSRGAEWSCDTATTVTNERHEDGIAAVLAEVYGIGSAGGDAIACPYRCGYRTVAPAALRRHVDGDQCPRHREASS